MAACYHDNGDVEVFLNNQKKPVLVKGRDIGLVIELLSSRFDRPDGNEKAAVAAGLAAEAKMIHFTVNAFDGESVGAFLKQYGKPVKLPPGGGGGGV